MNDEEIKNVLDSNQTIITTKVLETIQSQSKFSNFRIFVSEKKETKEDFYILKTLKGGETIYSVMFKKQSGEFEAMYESTNVTRALMFSVIIGDVIGRIRLKNYRVLELFSCSLQCKRISTKSRPGEFSLLGQSASSRRNKFLLKYPDYSEDTYHEGLRYIIELSVSSKTKDNVMSLDIDDFQFAVAEEKYEQGKSFFFFRKKFIEKLL